MNSRFAVGVFAALAMLAAGCSGSQPANDSTTDATPTTEAAEATEATEEVSEEAASEEVSEASEETAAAGEETQYPVTFTTSAGEVTIDAVPEKVAVLEWGALDTFNALGLNDKVVAAPMNVNKEELEKLFPNAVDVGNPRELDKEALALAEPDLIITGIRSQEVGSELAGEYKVYDDTIDYADYVNSSIQASKDIAIIMNEQAQAAEYIEGIEKSAEELKKAGEGKGTAMVLMASGGEISTFGQDNRMSSLVFDIAGLKPAFEVTVNDRHGQVVTYEAIRDANPDYIFVFDRDAAIGKEGSDSAKVLMDNDLVNETTAAKEGHIFYPDTAAQYLTIHGLVNTKALIDDLVKDLNS